MKLDGCLLTAIAGKEVYRKLLGASVFDISGAYIGYLKRVYLEKRSGKARRLVVRLVDGRLLTLKPGEVRLTARGLLVERAVGVIVREYDVELKWLEEAVRELRKIRERVLEVDELYIAGEISRDTYLLFRSELELKRRELLRGLKEKVEELEAYLSRLEEERSGLLGRLRSSGLRERGGLAIKLKALRSKISYLNDLLEAAKHELSLEMELEDFINSCLR